MSIGSIVLVAVLSMVVSRQALEPEADDAILTLVKESSAQQDWVAFRVSVHEPIDEDSAANFVCRYFSRMDAGEYSSLRLWIYHPYTDDYIASWMEDEASVESLRTQAARMQAAYLWSRRKGRTQGDVWIYRDSYGQQYPSEDRPWLRFDHTTDCPPREPLRD